MSTGANLNTILLTVSIGLLSWMAYTTHTTSNAMAALQVKVDTLDSSYNRLANQWPDNVSKREFDARVLAIESRLSEHALRLREIDLQVIKLQTKIQ